MAESASAASEASEDGDGTGEDEDTSDEEFEALKMGDKTGLAMTLCGQVTRGISSHLGKDLTDTWTEDILPTLAEGK